MAEQNLIKLYVDAPIEKRVDIIIKNYTNFMGIVDGYTEGLRYMIESEKESNLRQQIGELGVRVQNGGHISDPTATKAIGHIVTRDAIVNCDFSGNVLEGVDRAEKFMKEAYLLRDMRKDFNLFNSQLCILGEDQSVFKQYISKEITLSEIAQKHGIAYESAQQRMKKNKLRVKQQVITFMSGNPGVIA